MIAENFGSREPSDFTSAAEPLARMAAASGFPRFPTGVSHSSPLNATPYVFRYPDFQACLLSLRNRERPLQALTGVIADARLLNVEVALILVGGSILDPSNDHPRDVDCVLLYRAARPGVIVDAQELCKLQLRAVSEGADVRFVPLDGDPLVVVKAVSFFTSLFGESKSAVEPGSDSRSRGLVLVDCRGDPRHPNRAARSGATTALRDQR